MSQRVKLDDIDRRILADLQDDGRMTNVELARRSGISAPPCLRRVRALEEAGFIRGYHADLNPEPLGFGVCAFAHVGLTIDAPQFKAFGAKYLAEFKSASDHNGIKGYTGMYILKAAIEKAGKADRVAVANALRNTTFSARQHPGILMDVSFDDKGDIDRESFLVEVKGGRQEVVATLPAIGKK